MIGVIYARYSEGPRQTDQSIEGQVADCRECARKNGIEIAEVYADRHVSGKALEGRYEFQRMLSDAEAGRFEVVIVWKIDRFGRDRTDIALAKLRLKKAGVRLMYAAESVPEGPEGIVLESVLEGIAEYYSAELRQKVIRGQRETVKKGLYSGTPLPIGYKVEDRRIVVDETTAPIVREVFRRYASGGRVLDLVAFMNEKGVVSSRGSRVSQAVVYRLLRNERYLGIFDQFGIELRVEPLIDRETFEACAARFPEPHQNAAGRASTDFRLSCKCFCGYCGALVVGESGRSKTGRVYFYYKCGAKKRGKKCELRPIRKELLEDAVLRATMDDMLTDETIGALTDEILRIQEAEREEDSATALRRQLESNRRRQKNLIAAIEEGTGAAGLARRLAELEDEAHELEIEITRADIKNPALDRETIEGWLRSFRGGDIHDAEFSRRLLETFVSRVEVRNDVIAIYYNLSEKNGPQRGVRVRSVGWSSRSLTRTHRPFVFEGFAVLFIETPRVA